MEQIPVIDYEDLRFMRTKAIEDIGQGFCKTGFAFIGSPEVTRLLPRIFKEFKNLFGLPYEIKAGYERKDIFRQRGWTPPYTEQAIACRKTGNNREDVPDAKEGWFMGPDRRTGLDMTNPVIHTHPHQYHPNVWPKEVPTFEYRMRQLYAHLLNPDSQLLGPGMSVMKALEHYLGKPLGYFEEMIKNAPTVLRAIHYPPIKPGEVDEIQWACKHTDINLVTILPASTKQGLWIRRRDGEWIPGNAPQGCVIAQVGDMLQYLTAGKMVSAVHEVRAPNHVTTEGRYSAALFVHARSDYILRPDTDDPRFPPIMADDLLMK